MKQIQVWYYGRAHVTKKQENSFSTKRCREKIKLCFSVIPDSVHSFGVLINSLQQTTEVFVVRSANFHTVNSIDCAGHIKNSGI